MFFRKLELEILEYLFEKELDTVEAQVRKNYPKASKYPEVLQELVVKEKRGKYQEFKAMSPSVLFTKFSKQVTKEKFPLYYSGIHLGPLVGDYEKEDRLLDVLENNL